MAVLQQTGFFFMNMPPGEIVGSDAAEKVCWLSLLGEY